MVRKMIIFGLFAVSIIVMSVAQASAGVWINGKYYAKGVQCEGEAQVKNIDKNPVTIACSADITVSSCPEGEPNVIVVCQNPGGNISTGAAFVDQEIFTAGFDVPFEADKKGVTTFSAILGTEGIDPPDNPNCLQEDGTYDEYCNCGYDTQCSTLRDATCPNPNWMPIDVVPLCMEASAASYYCDNDGGSHVCPCDPTITTPSDPKACASATGDSQIPFTYDWSQTGGVLVPAAIETSDCYLPDPDTFAFGDHREYDCTVVLDTYTK